MAGSGTGTTANWLLWSTTAQTRGLADVSTPGRVECGRARARPAAATLVPTARPFTVQPESPVSGRLAITAAAR